MTTDLAAIVVLAKAPVPGRVKTRLCPPCTPDDAAALARAALVDTLAAVAATPASRHVLVLDGAPGDWTPRGFEVVPQACGDLAARLAAAFVYVAGPALLVGMDTPQVTPALLADARGRLEVGTADAVLGPADDGGYWAIGLVEPTPSVFSGVPMSVATTGALQLERLHEHGCRVDLLPQLRDVDRYADAAAAAHAAPATRFAAAFRAIDRKFQRA
ncbi:MAG TPA: TIGR04282 family arsenosugar biosynthesis glycosyltransferase [Acidimicrobiia bacterium]|jgi:hypothetical protein|nr:TIGR04282 family arsenosugar biosynthesis glycosyltransferase [Acidimicrobiia bacterium]